MNTIETYEFPGKTIRLELPLEGEQTSSNDTVAIALDAARRIAGDDLRFHCMDVLIGTFDPELLYALNDLVEDGSTFLFKKMESPPALVCGKIWVNQQTVSLKEFDWNTLGKATLQILTDWPQGKESEAIVLWKNIEFRGVKARIRGVGDATLKVRWMNRERGVFIRPAVRHRHSGTADDRAGEQCRMDFDADHPLLVLLDRRGSGRNQIAAIVGSTIDRCRMEN